jgi:exonuclease SbcC
VAVSTAAAARQRREATAAELDALSEQWAVAEAEQRAHQAATAELRVREQELAERTRTVERLTQQLAAAVSAVEETAALQRELAPMAALLAERDALDALMSAEGRRTALVDAERAVVSEIAIKEARQSIIATAPQLEEELTTQLEAARLALAAHEKTLDSANTDWVRDRQEAETKRDALRVQYAELRDQRERIIEAGEAGLCPTCQRPIGANYRALLDTLDQQLDVVKVDGNYWKARVTQLADRPGALVAMDAQRTELQQNVTQLDRKLQRARFAAAELGELVKERARLDARLAGVRADLATLPTGYDQARHDAVRRELDRLGPLERRLTRLSAAAEEEPQVRMQMASAISEQQVLTSRVESLRAGVAATAANATQWTSLKAVTDAAAAAANAAAVADAAASAELAGADERLRRAQAADVERQRAAARRLELSRARRLHDELDKTYADLRTDLNFALRPELSELASRFLADLTDGRYDEFELDDQYDLVIVEDGLPKPVISGGEEDLANLVLRLAISQMIAERAGQSFTLLILDEIFGSLDEVRRQNVVDLLRRLHDRFEQVILITHIESVRDGCDQVLSVRYDPRSGAARVTTGDEDEVVADDALALA